eukprot:6777166-Pyramimonas_sp.AAC.2
MEAALPHPGQASPHRVAVSERHGGRVFETLEENPQRLDDQKVARILPPGSTQQYQLMLYDVHTYLAGEQGPRGEQGERVGNWTQQGEKRGRVSSGCGCRVHAPLP